MKLTGAQITIEMLKREGAPYIFGLPGGAILPTFDALYDSGLNFILVRHEQGAGHMADGYARSTGKPAVCMVTSGPGALNLVTAIATANMDSVPMVCITGQVATHLIGNDAFQEADVIGCTRPITKHSYLVKKVEDLPRIIKEAFYIASTGRPGPVLVDLPVDVTRATTDFEYPTKLSIRGYNPPMAGEPKNIELAADLIMKSKKPLLYVGGGTIASGANKELLELAEKTGIPVTTTLAGLGAFPETHAQSLRMLGMHGTVYANYSVQACDLLISVGARFDDRVTGKLDKFAPNAKIIHIDIDPASISKNVKVDCAIVGDVRTILKELNKLVKHLDLKAWNQQIADWREKHPMRFENNGSGIKSQHVIQELGKATNSNAIVTTGVGQHQMWAAQWFNFIKPRTMITSGGLGTMGYGFPAAIGAQLAHPGETVFCIDGDGSFQMTSFELATAVHYKIPVKIALLDNAYLGMVRQWQEMFYKERYSGSELGSSNPDFVKLAESFGMKGILATKKEDVRPTIDKALEHDGPVLMHFKVEKQDNVFPMVPAGQALDQVIDMA